MVSLKDGFTVRCQIQKGRYLANNISLAISDHGANPILFNKKKQGLDVQNTEQILTTTEKQKKPETLKVAGI